ncbi:MAG: acyl-CoA dehydrogenase family protein [Myxococcota bacterium]
MPQSPRLARDEFDAWKARAREGWFDPHLASLIRWHGHAGAEPALRAFADACAGPVDAWARNTNRDENLPRLYRWDDIGNRTEEVAHHPDHHEIGKVVWGSGIMSRYGTPGRELETLGLLYLLAQDGEGGHCCPLACTAGMIRILQASPDSPRAWLERLLDPDYARRWHASQFLTEVQGGSDVGANAVIARPAADGWWEITGEKWFCSVIDAKLFLLTARPEGAPPGTGGLRAFVVPRELDGRPNGFEIRRLKYKLGTRSMASAEVDFVAARGWPVAEFRKVMELVLNTSRLYNAVCAAGFLQRAWREADAYARARTAFTQPILGFPIIARVVARLKTEAYAARATSFLLAAHETHDEAWRMLVNLNKIWTATTCPAGVRDAIEVLGGNGAIEEFSVLPRLLRDSIVLEAWEGGHGVLCNQLLKDSRRGMHAPMFDWLERLGGHPRLAEVRARWERVVAHPRGEAHVRDVVEELRPIAQAAVLLAESRAAGSDPLLPVIAEHLVVTNARGWDPLADEGLEERVARINAA